MSDVATISPRREKTRQRLMAAARSVIAEKGVLAASVEEICERAGFTRGAFYSNFDSRDDLALELLRESAGRLIGGAERAIAQALEEHADTDSVAALIARAIDTFVTSQPSGRDEVLLQAELRLHAVRDEEFRAAYVAFGDEMTALFAGTIAESLAMRNLALAIPVDRAVDLLRAVHDTEALDALIAGVGGEPGDSLKTLLRAMVRAA